MSFTVALRGSLALFAYCVALSAFRVIDVVVDICVSVWPVNVP